MDLNQALAYAERMGNNRMIEQTKRLIGRSQNDDTQRHQRSQGNKESAKNAIPRDKVFSDQ